MKIAYICGRKKCERCSDSCHHTLDINHAKNFEKLCDDAGNVLAYEERDAVRHGKWIPKEIMVHNYYAITGFKCSVCGEDALDDVAEPMTDYCPHCGARMDGNLLKDDTND